MKDSKSGSEKESGVTGVRLGAELRAKVLDDAKRRGLTPSAAIREIVAEHYRQQADREALERLGAYLKQLGEEVMKIRRDTKGVPQGVARIEEGMREGVARIEQEVRAFHEEFERALVR